MFVLVDVGRRSAGAGVACFCGEPATWCLVSHAGREPWRGPIEHARARDLFRELCDGCFVRAVAEDERQEWHRPRVCADTPGAAVNAPQSAACC